MQVPGIKKILVNIALPENLKRIRNSDPEQNPALSLEFLRELKKEKDGFFSAVFNEEYKQQTYLIYGTRDMVAPNEGFFKKYFNDESRIFHIDMEHKMDERGAKIVCELIYGNEDVV